ncbi:hypothetical protein EH165_02065 [Nakamurella antarctica]|uniref:Uncharacterized protein n=1 Tax=Nakamurella antarctica TaxID=1902245 RepID=A0A3G8ZII0_9ACTN|nr:hypothetical protein [Nakamurella antarctica]AZI57133.1 hypothetical protein EH165_02065 [Nakamurella antarctica]
MTDPNNPFSAGQPQQPAQPYQAQPGQPQQPYQGQPYQGQPDSAQQPYQGQPEQPYQQQPYQQPHQAQPGQPQFGMGLPGEPGAASPFAPVPASSTPSRNAALLKRFLVPVLVIVVAVVAFGWRQGWFTSTPGDKLAVGDCAQMTGTSVNVDITGVDCGSAKSTFKITAKGEGITCDEYESEYTESGTGASKDKLCLGLDAKVGDCFKLGMTSLDQDAKIDCQAGASDTSVFKITEVNLTSADESLCPAGDQPVGFPKRNTLLCFGPNQ